MQRKHNTKEAVVVWSHGGVKRAKNKVGGSSLRTVFAVHFEVIWCVKSPESLCNLRAKVVNL